VRILLVADWPRLEGGTESYVAAVREGLREAGDDVRLLTGSAGSRADGTADVVAPSAERLAAQAFLQVANPLAAAAVRRAVRELAPEAVLVTTFLTHLSPAILLPLRRVPTVLLVADYRPVCPVATKLLPDGALCSEPAGTVCMRRGCVGPVHWLRDRPRYALLRAGLASVDRVVACSESLRRALADAGIRADAVDLPIAPPADRVEREPSASPTFVYAGRLRREKGVDLLL
jgi:glycosyltransferase involved in cell wall biosynthesis